MPSRLKGSLVFTIAISLFAIVSLKRVTVAQQDVYVDSTTTPDTYVSDTNTSNSNSNNSNSNNSTGNDNANTTPADQTQPPPSEGGCCG
ncbi:MAG: hypothetical protein NT031_08760 [Planctomycetota bacterium]|nr:hypothetical protein [Planctomycetota bacterium]